MAQSTICDGGEVEIESIDEGDVVRLYDGSEWLVEEIEEHRMSANEYHVRERDGTRTLSWREYHLESGLEADGEVIPADELEDDDVEAEFTSARELAEKLPHVCDRCGARYSGQRAARGCCTIAGPAILPDGGQPVASLVEKRDEALTSLDAAERRGDEAEARRLRATIERLEDEIPVADLADAGLRGDLAADGGRTSAPKAERGTPETMDSKTYEDRWRELRDRTALKPREAQVQALKEQDLSHSAIADELEISKSAVDEYSRRINDRVERARGTVEEIPDDQD